MFRLISTSAVLLATPLSVLAATTIKLTNDSRTFSGVVNTVLKINQYLIYFIFTLTFLVLIWTVINTWIINVGDETSVAKGKKIVTVGIIVLVVMSGMWGILAILRSTLTSI